MVLLSFKMLTMLKKDSIFHRIELVFMDKLFQGAMLHNLLIGQFAIKQLSIT